MTARRAAVADHRATRLDHRKEAIHQMAFVPAEVAIQLGLVAEDADPDSKEAISAYATVREWLRRGKAIREGKTVKPSLPYLFGINTGARWIVPGAEVADFLDRAKPASEQVAS